MFMTGRGSDDRYNEVSDGQGQIHYMRDAWHGCYSCDLLDVRRKITKNKNRVGTGNCKK